ncbi:MULTISPECIES: LysR family transcriptional regulator [unclassified Aureimonas]|uniref:LysR family transcriptional regulator n=1 Tax=unclassified Aureimonas TaxID=2615206 RepID=UPI0006F6F589|nr:MULTISPECIES: LysR family transcriptional regulator [unclassified Aureimonas]KQT52488.1 transcriptional regulator [Aureimonas sp. Leaf427]KQT77611.1 transcriptional regulator [Aureimonas sp. Leaf460]
MDQLTALKVFRAAARSGSFAEASRKLGLSAGAISKNISELEAHLRVRLFNRTTRRRSLTEAGSAYLGQIEQALDALDRADETIRLLSDRPAGTLRVAAPLSLSLVCFSRIVPRFLSAYPDVSLLLDLDDRKVDLVEGGYDMAIRGSDRLEDSSLMARALTDLPHVVCAAPAYLAKREAPSSPEDLPRHDCLRYTLSDRANEWVFTREGETRRIAVTGRFQTTSSLAIREALLEGLGVGLLPLPYVAADLAEGRLVRLLGDWTLPTATVYAIYPSRHHVSPKLRAFIEIITDDLKTWSDRPGGRLAAAWPGR